MARLRVAPVPPPCWPGGPHAIFPDQFAGAAVERLHDVVGIREIDDAVVHQRRGLIGAAFVHGPHPGQPQIAHVVARDLRKRAVVPCLVIAADHQPVARDRDAAASRRLPARNFSLRLRRLRPPECPEAPGERGQQHLRRLCLGGLAAAPPLARVADGERCRGRQRAACRVPAPFDCRMNATISTASCSPSVPGLFAGMVL